VVGVIATAVAVGVATTVLPWVVWAATDVVGLTAASEVPVSEVAVAWDSSCSVDVGLVVAVGFDVGGAGSTGSRGSTGAVGSVVVSTVDVVPVVLSLPWVPVCAPPEDDTVTPGATSTVFDDPVSASFEFVAGDGVLSVVPDCGAEVAVASWVGSGAADPESVLEAAAVPWLPVEVASLAASVVAHARPAGVAMAEPTPSATARAPIRPTKLLYFIAHDPEMIRRRSLSRSSVGCTDGIR
jgi:hypothetical protein